MKQNNYEVALLTRPEQLDEIEALYNNLNDYLAETENFPGWQKHIYPTREVAKKGFENNSLYIAITQQKQIVGTVILDSNQPQVYKTINWEENLNDSQVLVVHTLAMDPNFIGKGVGTLLLDFAQKMAIEKKLKAIRLDTFQKNKPAIALYEKLGYKYMGLIDLKPELRKSLRIETMYCCFEKLL